jgi:hypothetical protein
MRHERIAMQLLALFTQRAAADRARIRLIESGVSPEDVLIVDQHTEDFLIEDEQSGSHMSFWAQVNAMVEPERQVLSLERHLRRGACLMGIRVSDARLSSVSALLKSSGARAQWTRGTRGTHETLERDDRCSRGRLGARPR